MTNVTDAPRSAFDARKWKCPETVRFQGLILVGATGFEHTPIAELIRAFGEPRKCPETETAEDAPATTAGGVAADVWRIAEFLRKIWKIAKNSYNAVVTL